MFSNCLFSIFHSWEVFYDILWSTYSELAYIVFKTWYLMFEIWRVQWSLKSWKIGLFWKLCRKSWKKYNFLTCYCRKRWKFTFGQYHLYKSKSHNSNFSIVLTTLYPLPTEIFTSGVFKLIIRFFWYPGDYSFCDCIARSKVTCIYLLLFHMRCCILYYDVFLTFSWGTLNFEMVFLFVCSFQVCVTFHFIF